jgi:hypothetical protein
MFFDLLLADAAANILLERCTDMYKDTRARVPVAPPTIF